MAAVSGVRTAHATLTGTTVDTVTLTGQSSRVTVINRSAAGAADLWVTFSPTSTAPSDPVAEADETYWIPAGGGFKTFANPGGDGIFKVLGNGNAYSVEGDDL